MTPEIRSLWLLTVLFLLVACRLAGAEQEDQADAIEAVFGPAPPTFTTRRIQARDLLVEP